MPVPSKKLVEETPVEHTEVASSNLSRRILVICNAYPSEASKYRNGFIHTRVKSYQEAGLQVLVFYEHRPVTKSYTYEYEGVAVQVGNEDALESLLRRERFDVHLVHFAEPSRIDPLRRAQVAGPVIVWVHGFEAEAWHRRWFNFIDSPESIRHAIRRKESYFLNQNRFIHDLINDQQLDVSFVNVSEWFQKHIVEPDVGTTFTDSKVIPNLIDEQLFPYVPKTADQRLKILSLRPYASRKYANDQTVKAILELSKRPYFDELEFTICGQGALFKSTTAPIANFKNVTLVESFFNHEQISELHRQHGVFLAPTRFDSQGVSLGEATSSGLVAISTSTASIPEYVKHLETGLLAMEESPTQLADNIERLYFDDALFKELSANGSSWMQKNCGRKATVDREIQLIKGKAARR